MWVGWAGDVECGWRASGTLFHGAGKDFGLHGGVLWMLMLSISFAEWDRWRGSLERVR